MIPCIDISLERWLLAPTLDLIFLGVGSVWIFRGTSLHIGPLSNGAWMFAGFWMAGDDTSARYWSAAACVAVAGGAGGPTVAHTANPSLARAGWDAEAWTSRGVKYSKSP